MSKYLALVALGSVNACHWGHHHHDPLFGLLRQGKNCPKSSAPKLNHMQANRLFLKNVYSGLVKGWYSENDHVVSEECFGNWMEPTFTTIWGLKNKAHEDFWSVGIDEVKDAGNQLVDLVYKNNEVCHFERIQDDFKHWCLEHPGQCLFLENLEERLFDNMFDIMGSFFDMFKMSRVDDSCFSDLEKMSEFNRVANDIGEILSSMSGFDYKWDQSIERTHIKKKAWHTEVKDAIKNYQYKDVDPLELVFPDLAEFIHSIEQAFRDFVHNVIETEKKMAHYLKPNVHYQK